MAYIHASSGVGDVWTLLGSNFSTIDLSYRPDYHNLTNSNFIVQLTSESHYIKSWNYSAANNAADGWFYPPVPSPSYNSETGILTINSRSYEGNHPVANYQANTWTSYFKVYLYIPS